MRAYIRKPIDAKRKSDLPNAQSKPKSRSRSRETQNKTPLKADLATPTANKNKIKPKNAKTEETMDASDNNRSKSAENVGIRRTKK